MVVVLADGMGAMQVHMHACLRGFTSRRLGRLSARSSLLLFYCFFTFSPLLVSSAAELVMRARHAVQPVEAGAAGAGRQAGERLKNGWAVKKIKKTEGEEGKKKKE